MSRRLPPITVPESIDAAIRCAKKIMRAERLQLVTAVRRGPIVQHRNGVTAHSWAAVILECGHQVIREDLKNQRKQAPKRVRCGQCAEGK